MKKSLLLFSALVLTFGVVLSFVMTKAQSPIDVNEANYRVPVIGNNYEITQLWDCLDHIGGGNEAGLKYMDINVEGAGSTDEGTPIYSSGNGTVVIAENGGTAHGLYIEIHNSEVGFRYMHLAKIYVGAGQQVYKGDLLGYMGNTGHSFGAHLHWEAWPMPGYSFNIVDIPGVNDTTGSCTSNSNDGTIDGPSRFRFNSCTEFSNAAQSSGFTYVVLFDHKECRGNAQVLTYVGTAGWDLTGYFNDRTRSIYIPPGKSVIVNAHADNRNVLYHCHAEDMWNLDIDHYDDNNNIRLGWQGGDGYNMISFVTVRTTSTCPSNVQASILGPSGLTPSYNSHVEGAQSGNGSGGGQTGNSHVDLFANTNFSGTQYGWDNPTYGWVNLPSAVNYMNDVVSSIQLDGDWSILAAQDVNGGGGRKCFVTSHTDLSSAYYDNGVAITDTISSVVAYHNGSCDGVYTGTSAGDQITFWTEANYQSTQYGTHDPIAFNLPNYLTDNMTSIGIVSGWSVLAYDQNDGQGRAVCITQADPDLSNNVYYDGVSANNSINSVRAFDNFNCSGWIPPTTPTPTPMSTATLAPTATLTATEEPFQGVELLPEPLVLGSEEGDDEESVGEFDENVLVGKNTIRITYNLHGLCALGGDASAFIFNQGEWMYVSLSDYGENCKDGNQTVDIPLSDFWNHTDTVQLDLNNSIEGIRARFWYDNPWTVEILSAIALTTGGSSPTVTSTATATTFETPTLTATFTPTFSPTPTLTATPTSTATATNTPTSVSEVELLSAPWHLSGTESQEEYQGIGENVLVGNDAVRITFDLHGLCPLGGDASAIIFNQYQEGQSGDWRYVSLSDYLADCESGVQLGTQQVTIPLADFGLNLSQPVGDLHTRFWYGDEYQVDITSIVVFNSPNW